LKRKTLTKQSTIGSTGTECENLFSQNVAYCKKFEFELTYLFVNN